MDNKIYMVQVVGVKGRDFSTTDREKAVAYYDKTDKKGRVKRVTLTETSYEGNKMVTEVIAEK